jgi:uncharacterized protein (DUF433 family)
MVSHITLEAGKRSGQPCIRGMRMTVADVLSYLASGMSPQEVLVEFPFLTSDDIRACLLYAASEAKQPVVVMAPLS